MNVQLHTTHSALGRSAGLWFFSVVLLLVFGASVVYAQTDEPPIVSLTRTQTEAIDQALGLARDNKHQEALRAFDALLVDIDMNLIHLNRGRVLQLMGQCREARTAFDRVLSAPRDPNVSRQAIRVALERFQTTLEQDCPGSLAVRCALPEMTVTVDGGEPKPCSGEPIELIAGEHEVVGAAFGEQITRKVTIRGTYHETLELSLGKEALVAVGRSLLGRQEQQRAMGFFEQVLRNEPNQEIYLYLVETLIGLKRCQEAFVALEEAPQVAPSSALSPVEFTRKNKDLRNVFGQVCGEPVLVECSPTSLTLRVDGGTPQVCSPRPIFLAVGEHELNASLPSGSGEAGVTLTRQVQVLEGSANRIVMNLEDAQPLGTLSWLGIGSVATGVTMLVAGVIIDQTIIAPEIETYNETNTTFRDLEGQRASKDSIETWQSTNVVLLVGGGALVVMGGALLATDLLLLDDEPLAPGLGVGVVLTDEEGSVMLQGVW